MFKKIFKFVTGYVIIDVTGKNSERFINMCLHNGLEIYNVVPIENGQRMNIKRRDFGRIRRIVYKCGVRVRIVSKHGLKERRGSLRRRCGFFVCGAAVCIFFLVIPQYIWCVEINGVYDADAEKISEALRECGVYVGAKKSGIAELSEIKDAVLRSSDDINWAWLYMEGSKARLEVQEATPVPAVDDMDTPTDIIAACDGVIRSAVVTRGERRVNAGMTVTAGELLVSGKVSVFREGYPEKYMYVHSQGRMIADTIRRKSGKYSTSETLRIKTGSSGKRLTLEIFGKSFNLFRDISCGYDEYDVTEEVYDFSLPIFGYLGISAVVSRVDEVTETVHDLTSDEVVTRAKEDLEEKICKELGTGAVKTGEELSFKQEGDSYSVELRMYFRENIGIEVPTEE